MLANYFLLTLIKDHPEHRAVACSLLDHLFDMSLSKTLVAKYEGSFEHRQQIRLWCTIHLLLVHITENDAECWINRALDAVEADIIVSTRSYAEWAAIRLLLRFPDHVNALWTYVDFE
jgi:hypothetical protein